MRKYTHQELRSQPKTEVAWYIHTICGSSENMSINRDRNVTYHHSIFSMQFSLLLISINESFHKFLSDNVLPIIILWKVWSLVGGFDNYICGIKCFERRLLVLMGNGLGKFAISVLVKTFLISLLSAFIIRMPFYNLNINKAQTTITVLKSFRARS